MTRGFTLIELMVAMAILALVTVLGHRGISALVESHASTDAEVRQWSDLAAFSAQLRTDLHHALRRPARDAEGLLLPALLLAPGETGSALVLTRAANGAGRAPGQAVRVGYRLLDGTVELLVWPAVDAAPGTAPLASAALSNVAAFHLRALDASQTWLASWPPGDDRTVLPRAVEMRLVDKAGREIVRLFDLP